VDTFILSYNFSSIHLHPNTQRQIDPDIAKTAQLSIKKPICLGQTGEFFLL
jgi:hypothetical protein